MIKEISVIIKKELKEIFRDRTTVIIMILPLLLFPILNFSAQFFEKSNVSSFNVSVINNDNEAYSLFQEFVDSTDAYKINVIHSDKPYELLNSEDIDCIISVNEDKINFIYASTSFTSLTTASKIGEAFQKMYFEKMGNNTYSFVVSDESNKPANLSFTSLNLITPIVFILLIFQSTTGFANDIFAGEKERKTLELLFLTGTNKKHIYLGKTISLLMLSFVTLIVDIIIYILSNRSYLQSGNVPFANEEILKNIFILSVCSILMIITSVFISSTVSMFSTTVRNSQLLNNFIMLIPIGFSFMCSFGLINDNSLFRYLPVLNLIMGFKDAFYGNCSWSSLGIIVLNNSVLILVFIIFSSRYLKSEKVFQ